MSGAIDQPGLSLRPDQALRYVVEEGCTVDIIYNVISHFVIPAKAGIYFVKKLVDSRFCGNDGMEAVVLQK